MGIIFSAEMDDCVAVHQKLSSIAIESGCREGDFLDISGIPNRCPSDLLHQVLQLDFEGLGKRLWTTIFIDVLLASGKIGGGVSLGHAELDNHIVSTNCDGGCSSFPGYLRLNASQPQQHKTDLSVDKYDDGVYSSFTQALISEKDEQLCGRGRCVAAIRNLVLGDVDTCQSLLELCFQAAWECLHSNQARAFLIGPLQGLLAKPFHSRFLKVGQSCQMNAVTSTLRLVIRLRPTPALDPFLLQSLGTSYNGCYEALTLLENQYATMKSNGYDMDSELIKAIQSCYQSLGDRDVCLSIASALSSCAGTRFALSLDVYDLVKEASDAYTSLIDRAGGDHAEVLPTESEFEVWEERWVAAQREMSQVSESS
jgi:hypothetical protein